MPSAAKTNDPTALALLELKVSCLGRAFPSTGTLQTFDTLVERSAAIVSPSAVRSKSPYWLESLVIFRCRPAG